MPLKFEHIKAMGVGQCAKTQIKILHDPLPLHVEKTHGSSSKQQLATQINPAPRKTHGKFDLFGKS